MNTSMNRNERMELINLLFRLVGRELDVWEGQDFWLDHWMGPLERYNNCSGSYQASTGRVMLNPNLAMESLPAIIAHELMHVVQHQRGVLRPTIGMTYEEYYTDPNEVEAIEYSERFCRRHDFPITEAVQYQLGEIIRLRIERIGRVA